MSVDAVKRSPDSPRQMSYVKASATGALIGYSLKYIIPVTNQEKDENYNAAFKESAIKTKKMKAAEIEKIRASKDKTELTDTFIRMYDAKTLQPSLIQKLNTPLKDGLLDMVKSLNEKARENLAIEKRNLNAITKSIRPTAVFVGIGVAVGFVSALIINIVRRIDYYNAQYPENIED